MKIYLVGGAIRNKLLGLPVKEKDWVVTGSTPSEMMSLGYKVVGKDFPVFLNPKTNEEFALARKESKISPGYKGFKIDAAKDITLIEDLKRRDLTINAIAEDSETGQLIDPFNGINDIKNKTFKHVSNSFSEDPVRVLRVARFSSKLPDFSIHPDTMNLMKKISTGKELFFLNPNRIWKEFEKALGEKNTERFIAVLLECGALKTIFPEIYNMFGVPNPIKYHPEIDTGIHSLNTLKESVILKGSKVAKFSALLHDIGKTRTPKSMLPNHFNHDINGVPIIKALCKRVSIPNKYKEAAVLTCKFHHKCHEITKESPKNILIFLKLTDAFRKKTRFDDFLIACEADAKSIKRNIQTPYKPSIFLKKIIASCKKIKFSQEAFCLFQNEKISQLVNEEYLSVITNFINLLSGK